MMLTATLNSSGYRQIFDICIYFIFSANTDDKIKKASKNRGGKLTVPSFNKPTITIHTCVRNKYLIARIRPFEKEKIQILHKETWIWISIRNTLLTITSRFYPT